MGVLASIHGELLGGGLNIGPSLLKLKFLAARIGSDFLEKWVHHEIEGYPKEEIVPDYRLFPVRITVDLSDASGGIMKNAPVPPHLVEQFCGKSWNQHEFRQSISVVDRCANEKDAEIGLDYSNLILILQGKIYSGCNILNIEAGMDSSNFTEVQFILRAKILDIVLRMEETFPDIAKIELDNDFELLDKERLTEVENITYQKIFGNYYGSTNTGGKIEQNIEINVGDREGLLRNLEKIGVSKSDAGEFLEVLEHERPDVGARKLGPKALQWLGSKVSEGVDAAWKATATTLADLAFQFYGIK